MALRTEASQLTNGSQEWMALIIVRFSDHKATAECGTWVKSPVELEASPWTDDALNRQSTWLLEIMHSDISIRMIIFKRVIPRRHIHNHYDIRPDTKIKYYALDALYFPGITGPDFSVFFMIVKRKHVCYAIPRAFKAERVGPVNVKGYSPGVIPRTCVPLSAAMQLVCRRDEILTPKQASKLRPTFNFSVTRNAFNRHSSYNGCSSFAFSSYIRLLPFKTYYGFEDDRKKYETRALMCSKVLLYDEDSDVIDPTDHSVKASVLISCFILKHWQRAIVCQPEYPKNKVKIEKERVDKLKSVHVMRLA